MRTIQPRVGGTVRLKLFKGDCRVVGRRSPLALEASAPSAAKPSTLQSPAGEGTVH
jgi:argininosuccinate synthase